MEPVKESLGQKFFRFLCAGAAVFVLVAPVEAAIIKSNKDIIPEECGPYVFNSEDYNLCIRNFNECSKVEYENGISKIEHKIVCWKAMEEIWQLNKISGKPLLDDLNPMEDDEYNSYGLASHERYMLFTYEEHILICNFDYKEFMMYGFYRCRWEEP